MEKFYKKRIYCDNNKDFQDLQKILFKQGYKWSYLGRKVFSLNPFTKRYKIIINLNDNTNVLTYSMKIDLSEEKSVINGKYYIKEYNNILNLKSFVNEIFDEFIGEEI